MCAVTIVALRRTGRTEFRNLAMEGLEVRFSHFHVTFTTLVQDAFPEVVAVDPIDCVRKVTAVADWKFLVGIGHQWTVHAVLEGLVDPQMTLAASCSNIPRIDGRKRVGGGKLVMSCVTIHTGGSYHQPTLQKSFPVDTHRVVLNDLVFRTGVGLCSLMTFTVTLPAEIGDVARKDRRVYIILRFNVMYAMTIRTIGGNGIGLFMILSMLARLVVQRLFRVTHRAVDRTAVQTNGIS